MFLVAPRPQPGDFLLLLVSQHPSPIHLLLLLLMLAFQQPVPCPLQPRNILTKTGVKTKYLNVRVKQHYCPWAFYSNIFWTRHIRQENSWASMIKHKNLKWNAKFLASKECIPSGRYSSLQPLIKKVYFLTNYILYQEKSISDTQRPKGMGEGVCRPMWSDNFFGGFPIFNFNTANYIYCRMFKRLSTLTFN